MGVYIVFTDVQYMYFALEGIPLSAGQQTIVGDLIDKAHGEILLYLGKLGVTTEPASTEGLKSIETQAVINLLWNRDNRDKDPRPVLTEDLEKRLADYVESIDTSQEDDFGTALTRDYETYYGY